MPLECGECGEVVWKAADHADDCPVPDRLEAREQAYIDSMSPEARAAWGVEASDE